MDAAVDDDEALRAELKARQAGSATAGAAFLRAGATRFLDNLLGVPDAIATGATNAMLALAPSESAQPRLPGALGFARSVTGMVPGAAALADRIRDYAPRVGDRVLPLPSGAQAVAAAGALGRSAAPTDIDTMGSASAMDAAQRPGVVQAYGQEMARGAQMRGDHPIASTLGDVAGDAATLVTGRMPALGALKEGEGLIAALKNPITEPGMSRAIGKVFTSEPMKKLYQGLGRSAETSLEGAGLAILKGDDPVDAALYSAAGQAAGSAGLSMGQAVWKHPLWATMLASAATYQVMKDLTPGGRDRILESLESGSSHAAHALLIGALSGMVGAGRLRSADVPRLADSLTSVPRGAMLSLITDMAAEDKDGGDGSIKRTIAHLTTNPNVFNKSQTSALEQGLKDGTFSEAVGTLVKKDPRFVKAIGADPRDVIQSDELDKIRADLKKRLETLGD